MTKDVFIDRVKVMELTGRTINSIYNLMRRKKFPQCVKIQHGHVRWRLSQIEEHVIASENVRSQELEEIKATQSESDTIMNRAWN